MVRVHAAFAENLSTRTLGVGVSPLAVRWGAEFYCGAVIATRGALLEALLNSPWARGESPHLPAQKLLQHDLTVFGSCKPHVHN